MIKKMPKLLIFDLDETLVHCVPYEQLEFDIDGNWISKSDLKLTLYSKEGIEDLYVNLRPFIRRSIISLKRHYQVILFTASTKDYADTIINSFDPYYELFETRLYRESWMWTQDEVYIKDLRIFEDLWNLKNIVIVDNSPHSFGLQLDNGYPITSYYNSKADKELLRLMEYLKLLSKENDVRKILNKTFVLSFLKDPLFCSKFDGVTEYMEWNIDQKESNWDIDEIKFKNKWLLKLKEAINTETPTCLIPLFKGVNDDSSNLSK